MFSVLQLAITSWDKVYGRVSYRSYTSEFAPSTARALIHFMAAAALVLLECLTFIIANAREYGIRFAFIVIFSKVIRP